MSASTTSPRPTAPEPAMLLVLLPAATTTRGEQPAAAQPMAALDALQARLGAAVRVLKIDEASHPAVVRSFRAAALPSCVLVRHGLELWRQSGLPDDEAAVELLLSKLALAQPV